MKIKASEYLAVQIDHLEDISKTLKCNYGCQKLERWNDLTIDLVKEIERIESNLNQLYIEMIKRDQEKNKSSEL